MPLPVGLTFFRRPGPLRNSNSCALASTHFSVNQDPSPTVSCVLTAPLLTDLDQRLFPVLLSLLQEENGNRLCMGNWNSSQITQLDHVVQPTDSVLSLSDCLLTLSGT